MMNDAAFTVVQMTIVSTVFLVLAIVVILLRARTPEMKLLFVSGYTDDALEKHGVSAASGPLLPKPYAAAALLRKMREVLERVADRTLQRTA